MNRQDFALLGLDETASITEIKRAFRRLAAIYHPDRGEQYASRFQRIYAAYDRLLAYHNAATQASATGSRVQATPTHAQSTLRIARERRNGRRGRPEDRRFEAISASQYIGTRIQTKA